MQTCMHPAAARKLLQPSCTMLCAGMLIQTAHLFFVCQLTKMPNPCEMKLCYYRPLAALLHLKRSYTEPSLPLLGTGKVTMAQGTQVTELNGP